MILKRLSLSAFLAICLVASSAYGSVAHVDPDTDAILDSERSSQEIRHARSSPSSQEGGDRFRLQAQDKVIEDDLRTPIHSLPGKRGGVAVEPPAYMDHHLTYTAGEGVSHD